MDPRKSGNIRNNTAQESSGGIVHPDSDGNISEMDGDILDKGRDLADQLDGVEGPLHQS